MNIGDKVIKNPETWIADDRDENGWRGTGIGIVVEPPFATGEDWVDVRWEGGRYFEKVAHLIKLEE
jgi:hypothetical protein